MVKIKICGLKSAEDIHMVNELKPDYIGFVFAKSPRMLEEDTAEKLREGLVRTVRPVGVFVNENPDRIVRLCKRKVIDMIQLHGDEDASYIRLLKSMTDKPVIKAVRVKNREQIIKAEQLPCEYLLFDTFVKDVYGGSGQQFDRTLIPKLKKPYFLAGGLNNVNVKQAISECSPYAVDVSSAVETGGRKEYQKVKEFLKEARSEREDK